MLTFYIYKIQTPETLAKDLGYLWKLITPQSYRTGPIVGKEDIVEVVIRLTSKLIKEGKSFYINFNLGASEAVVSFYDRHMEYREQLSLDEQRCFFERYAEGLAKLEKNEVSI